MIAVCDANVLASGFIGFARTESAPGEILRRWRNADFTLIYSAELRAELERTLRKPYFAQRRTRAQRAAALALLDHHATRTALTVSVNGVAPDPDDDHVISAAVSSGADYLVTGDRSLGALGSYQGVEFVSPRDFLDILNAARSA